MSWFTRVFGGPAARSGSIEETRSDPASDSDYARAEEMARKRLSPAYIMWGKDETLALFDRVCRESPGAAFAWLGRARCYLAQGKHGTAMKDIEIALGLAPQDANCWWLKGRIHSVEGARDKAVEDASRALSHDPRHYLAYSLRGGCYFALGMYEDAAKDLKKCKELEPGILNPDHLLKDIKRKVQFAKRERIRKEHPEFADITSFRGDELDVAAELWSRVLPNVPLVTEDIIRDYGVYSARRMSYSEAAKYVGDQVARMRSKPDYNYLSLRICPEADCAVVGGYFQSGGTIYYNKVYVWRCDAEYVCGCSNNLKDPWD
jgi:tetratricopeptide (TPR) repeat protein